MRNVKLLAAAMLIAAGLTGTPALMREDLSIAIMKKAGAMPAFYCL